MLDRTVAPPFRNITNIHIPQPDQKILSNGNSLFYIRSGSEKVLKLDIFISAGKWREKEPGAALFTGKMLSEGSKHFTSSEISEVIDSYGAYLEVSPGFDYLVVSLYCLSKHFTKLAPLLADIISEPQFPEKELELMRNIQVQTLEVNLQKTSFVANQLFRKTIFGSSHPYGRISTMENLQALQRGSVEDHYKEFIHSAPSTLIASGNFDDSLLEEIDASLGSVTSKEQIPVQAFETTTGDYSIYDEWDGFLQTSIRMGKESLPMVHPDFPKLNVVNEILGGYFGSRLMKNIREDKGLTYGIYSSISHMKNASYFIIAADVNKENRLEAIEEIHNEIRKLGDEPIGSDELETVRNYMLGQFQAGINTPFALASKFRNIYFNGLDYSYYDRLIQAIHDITKEDVMELSTRYLADDNCEVMVG